MRLISQDGKYDVPYEGCWLKILTLSSKFRIEAWHDNGFYIQLGLYKNEEQALKVMEEIRNEYVNCEFSWYQLPKDEEVTCTD